MCTVSVAGPYRKGKSYILSEAFDQSEVFPLGHEMEAETMGIWMCILPEKYKVHISNFLQNFSIDIVVVGEYKEVKRLKLPSRPYFQ